MLLRLLMVGLVLLLIGGLGIYQRRQTLMMIAGVGGVLLLAVGLWVVFMLIPAM